jgi:hypothetical protein
MEVHSQGVRRAYGASQDDPKLPGCVEDTESFERMPPVGNILFLFVWPQKQEELRAVPRDGAALERYSGNEDRNVFNSFAPEAFTSTPRPV